MDITESDRQEACVVDISAKTKVSIGPLYRGFTVHQCSHASKGAEREANEIPGAD